MQAIHDRQTSDLLINAKVVSAIVKDPYSQNGEYITATRSVRDDPLADMHSRRVIDQAEYEAGRAWQRYHEITEIGPISAIDPTKEAVDGGKVWAGITDRQLDAFAKLQSANKMLGHQGAELMHGLLSDGLTVGQLCQKYDCRTARRANFLSMRVRECLNDLAKHFGLAG